MNGEQSTESLGERRFMEQAIEELIKCSGKGPRVGAVIVVGGRVVSVGHRVAGTHAERAAIETAQRAGMNLNGAALFTTLEPCVSIGSSQQAKESCADLICRVGISKVVVGCYDPNPHVYRRGWKVLRDAGVKLRDFDPELRSRIDDINATFIGHFESGIGPIGGAKFDYLLNDGDYEIAYSSIDPRSIVTRWTMAGKRAIYAYGRPPVRVALARYAEEFDEIDDPRALDFGHSMRVEEGEIAAFVCETGCALVKVLKVHSGPNYGSDHTSVQIQYEIRIFAANDP